MEFSDDYTEEEIEEEVEFWAKKEAFAIEMFYWGWERMENNG